MPRMRTIILTLLMFFITTAALGAAGSGEQAETSPELLSLEAGVMPILPVSQFFIISEKGWDREEGLVLNQNMFQSGPAMVQAVASGNLDIMFFGIGPAMVSRSRGQDIAVITSLIIEQMSFIARDNLAMHWDERDPAGVFRRFREENGRRAKIATFQEGSVPHVVLMYWLENVLQVGTEDVEILGMGANAVQQAMLSGAVDGASTLEPIVSIVSNAEPGSRVLARGSQLFPRQPGAVLAVRSPLFDEYPDLGERLVRLIRRATDFIRDEPGQASEIIAGAIGDGLVDPQIIESALRSSRDSFVADPRIILESTAEMQRFQVEIGTLAAEVDIEELIDVSYFETTEASD